jgi:hypothetical protein
MTSTEQSTYGQRAVGIKIVKDNGTEIGFGTAIGRWIASLFSSLLLKIGYLIAIFTVDKKTLHDIVAGTLVIESEQQSERNEIKKKTSNATTQIKNKKIEVNNAKKFDSMEDAYIKVSEIKQQTQQPIKKTNEYKESSYPQAKRIESMEDAYAQITNEKEMNENNLYKANKEQ